MNYVLLSNFANDHFLNIFPNINYTRFTIPAQLSLNVPALTDAEGSEAYTVFLLKSEFKSFILIAYLVPITLIFFNVVDVDGIIGKYL